VIERTLKPIAVTGGQGVELEDLIDLRLLIGRSEEGHGDQIALAVGRMRFKNQRRMLGSILLRPNGAQRVGKKRMALRTFQNEVFRVEIAAHHRVLDGTDRMEAQPIEERPGGIAWVYWIGCVY
jgi:hypothetical protein